MYTDNNEKNKIDDEYNNDTFELDNNEFDNNFYGYDDQDKEQDNSNKNSSKTKKIVIIVIIILLLLACIVGLIFFFTNNDNGNNNGNGGEHPVLTPNVILSDNNIELKVGSSKVITYTIENYNGDVGVTWSTSDKSIATVSSDGTVKAIKVGSVTITAIYVINDIEYEKSCLVTVIKKDSSSGGSSGTTSPSKDKTAPKLSYTIASGKENTWVNTNVSIKVSASDNSGNVTVKYTTNCNTNCKYTTVSNGLINVDSTGSSVIRIVATDKSDNSTEKKVTVMIDKIKPTCSLKVSDVGTLSATYKDTGGSGISYYGFNSSYSGTSGNIQQLSSNGNSGSDDSQEVSKAGTYKYYVKDKAGNTNTCSLDVKAKTQYRYRDCIGCSRCVSAGCEYYYSSSYSTFTSPSDVSLTTSTHKDVCTASGDSYTCSRYYCAQYKRSCSLCINSSGETCDTWGEFSSWTDKKYVNSNSREVQTKVIYYSE